MYSFLFPAAGIYGSCCVKVHNRLRRSCCILWTTLCAHWPCPTKLWRRVDMDVGSVLPVVWFGIIGFAILMYVLMDGFVLGIGILAPFSQDERELDQMMNSAAPIWDGNETWL